MRADYLDQVVWGHIMGLLADPSLVRSEIDRRLDDARVTDPVVHQRKCLDVELAKAGAGITRMIQAFSEHLITIDELLARMPDLRAREVDLRHQIQALDAQLADRQAYPALAENLERFLARLRDKADTATITKRQQVLRLLIKDILIGPDKIIIQRRIPVRHPAHPGRDTPQDSNTDSGYP